MSFSLPPQRPITRRVALAISIPFLVFLAVLTLSPRPVEESAPGLLDAVLRTLQDGWGWSWLTFDSLEVIANIAVFIPVGCLAFVLLPRRVWPLAFAVGPLLSSAIELAQAARLPERTASLADVLANSTGATLGAALALIVTALAVPEHPMPSPTLDAP